MPLPERLLRAIGSRIQLPGSEPDSIKDPAFSMQRWRSYDFTIHHATLAVNSHLSTFDPAGNLPIRNFHYWWLSLPSIEHLDRGSLSSPSG